MNLVREIIFCTFAPVLKNEADGYSSSRTDGVCIPGKR